MTIDPSSVIQLVQRLDYPRVMGSEGEDRAFQVIRAEVEALDIPVAFEPFAAPWIEFDRAYLEIAGRWLPIQPLISPAYGSEWLPIPRTFDLEATLFDPPIPKGEPGPAIALRRVCTPEEPCTPGAAAQVFACLPETEFVAYYLTCEAPIPSAYVSPEHEALLSRSVGARCRFRWQSVESERTFRNMSAQIVGKRFPGEMIIIGAHIDSWPGTVGASDNACGSAMLVAFARAFVEHPPLRTVRLVWFTGEELDRRGSRAYVAAHVQETIRLYVNVDSGFSVEHGEPQVAASDEAGLIEAIEGLLAARGRDAPVHESAFDATDALAFHERGIPSAFVHAHMITPPPHPHLPTDRYDTLVPDKVERIGDLSLAIADAAQRGALLEGWKAGTLKG